MIRPLILMTLAAACASAVPIYLTTSTNQLLSIDSATPGTIATNVAITGLQASESIHGIDFRPANGTLYALGSTSRLYTVNTATGVATQVGTAGLFSLLGTSFGLDFNPVPDRVRVTSNTGQNLRLNPNDGSLAATDTMLNPGTPSIVGSAYTNSFAGTATTTLYGIDSVTSSLYTQNPPNNGTLNLVGALGLSFTSLAGFDIAWPGNTAYAALQPIGGVSGLYTINLTTGAATLVGSIGSGQLITGLAVQNQVVPEPSSFVLLGLGGVAILLRRRYTPLLSLTA
jgi:hypothetical protein